MRPNIKALLFGAFAIIPGLVVLLGYFLDFPILIELRELLLQWAVILTAVALFVGLVNLISVHWRKISTESPGWGYSIVLIISFVITLLVVGYFSPASAWSLWIFNYVQIPIAVSLMAVLAVVLILAVARMFSRRLNIFTFFFVGTILIVLIGTITIPYLDIPGLHELRTWIVTVWATAGARGILLGIALGTIATGLRILMGTDRPYSG